MQTAAKCNIQHFSKLFGQQCCVRLQGVPGRHCKFFESMNIFERAGLSFTRRGTNTGRIQSVFEKTSVRKRLSCPQTWSKNEHHGLLIPFWLSPPQGSLCVVPLLFSDYCYFNWGTQMEPPGTEEAFSVKLIFFINY